MYELKNGSIRLAMALETAVSSPERLRILADLLYYCEDQLAQDVQALSDFRNTMVSLEACKGYVIAAACSAGIYGIKAEHLMNALDAAFENMTVSEAEEEAAK